MTFGLCSNDYCNQSWFLPQCPPENIKYKFIKGPPVHEPAWAHTDVQMLHLSGSEKGPHQVTRSMQAPTEATRSVQHMPRSLYTNHHALPPCALAEAPRSSWSRHSGSCSPRGGACRCMAYATKSFRLSLGCTERSARLLFRNTPVWEKTEFSRFPQCVVGAVGDTTSWWVRTHPCRCTH